MPNRQSFEELITSLLTVTNKQGFKIRHNGSGELHLTIKPGTAQTAERFLTLTIDDSGRLIADADRTLNLIGSPSLGNIRIVSGTAAPTTGTWNRGDICLNTEP